MKTRIIVDSTADLTPNFKERVQTVPLTVRFGDEEFIDGVTIERKAFYEKLIESDALPTTSQATPDTFIKKFEEVKNAGDSAVVITLASKLSGTYQSAMIAAADYDNIYVVDSQSVTIGSGILVERAFELLDAGMSAEAIATTLNKEKENIMIVALLDTLEYLKKGGRISSTVAFVGGMLNIKPVISIEDGTIKMLGKARGTKIGNNMIIDEINKTGGVDFSKPVLFGYTGISDDLITKFIEDSKQVLEGNLNEVRYESIGSVVGTHAGPGAVAVAFFKK